MEDFISTYLSYASASSEVPMIYHRWSCLSGLGAFLGRQYNMRHGHFIIQPNMYCMLIGTPGTRKSSAIKIMKSLLTKAGYNTYAAEKTSKEKFLIDLAKAGSVGAGIKSLDGLLDNNLWMNLNGDTELPNSELYITADEFNDFFGNNILEFLSMLGSLWDRDGVYENKIKNGESVIINNPTINIIGGNTPTTFAHTFPPEIFGQGFFSRTLIIYGESTGKKITFPDDPDREMQDYLVEYLKQIKLTCLGTVTPTPRAKKLLDKIYTEYQGIEDVRFGSYSTRRLTHLFKLCLITSAASLAKTIDEEHVIYANTILSHAENYMPKALGEFGKGKNSDVTHKLMEIVNNASSAVSFKELWSHLHTELEGPKYLGDLIINLLAADKLQKVGDEGLLLPKRRMLNYTSAANDTVDWSILSDEERNMSK